MMVYRCVSMRRKLYKDDVPSTKDAAMAFFSNEQYWYQDEEGAYTIVDVF